MAQVWYIKIAYIKIALGFFKKIHIYFQNSKQINSSFFKHCLDSAVAQLHVFEAHQKNSNYIPTNLNRI